MHTTTGFSSHKKRMHSHAHVWRASLALLVGCSMDFGADVIELGPCASGDCIECGSTAGFGDDFEDGVRGDGWYSSDGEGGAQVSEQGGVLILEPGSAGANTAHYLSADLYDAVESSVVVEAVQVLPASALAWTHLQLITPQDERIRLYTQEGSLCASIRPSGTEQVLSCVPYQASAHRWWEIRETDGQLVWRVGPDRTASQVLETMTTTFPVEEVYVELEAGVADAVASPGQARFDNLNPDAATQDGARLICSE